jgi:hypothetical protein
MTNWYANNGDGLTTGYWAIQPWKCNTSYPTGSIIRQPGGVTTMAIAMDFTNSKIWYKDLTRNSYWNDVSTDNPATNTGGSSWSPITGPLFPAVAVYNFDVQTVNFGATAFAGTVPSGFSSVNAAAGTTVTLNPSDKNANVSLDATNLIASGSTSGGSNNTWYAVRATASFSSGLVYYETTISWLGPSANYFMRNQNFTLDWTFGWANSSMPLTNWVGQDANSVGWVVSQAVIKKNNTTITSTHRIDPVSCGNERAYRNAGSTFTSGTSGAGPSFPLGANNTVADGTGTWTECTGQAAYGWNACWARYDNIIQRMALVGDVCFVGDNSVHCAYGITTVTIGQTGASWNGLFISVDHTVSSPGAGDYKAGATLIFSQTIMTIAGNFTMQGFTFRNEGTSGSSSTCTVANNYAQRYLNCTFAQNGFGPFQLGPGGNGTCAHITFINCTFTTSQSRPPLRTYGARTIFRGGSISTTSGQQPFESLSSNNPGDLLLDGVDMSGVLGSTLFLGGNNFIAGTIFNLARCKLPNATFLQVGSVRPGDPEINWVACDNGTDLESHGRADGLGIQTESKTIVRSGGASDGVAGYSEQLATNGNTLVGQPFHSLPMDIWNTLTAVNRTLTVYGIANTPAMPQTTDIWVNVRYLGNSSFTLGSEVTTGPANLLSAGSNYTADASAWDTGATARGNSTAYAVGAAIKVAANPGRVFFCTGAGTSASSQPGGYATAVDGGSVTDGGATFRAGWRFSMAVTMSSPQPQLTGLITAQVEIQKSSATYYIDPLTAASLS